VNKQKFVELLRSPDNMSNSDLAELEVFTKENPYFQSGHIIVARGSKLLKNKSAARRINTAATYSTNRTVLKDYMQGNIVLAKPAPQFKSVSETPIKSELKEKPAQVTQEKTKAPITPRKAPESLSKSDHDLLIDDIYANLEKWKKSRDQYLEFEKASDELELSTHDENLEDAVEKIKNQIAEEVTAEDKIVSDQIEKIEAAQVKDEVEDSGENEVNEIIETESKVEPILPLKIEHKEDVIEEIKEKDTSDKLSHEATSSDKKENLEIANEKNQKSKLEIEVKEIVETTSSLPDEPEKKEKTESKTKSETKKPTKTDKPAAVKKKTPLAKKKSESATDIDLSDNQATTQLIDDEVSKSISIDDGEKEAVLDEKIDTIKKEKDELKLEPRVSKTGKKFRLSILNRPSNKVKKTTITKKKNLAPEEKSVVKTKAAVKNKPTSATTKKTTKSNKIIAEKETIKSEKTTATKDKTAKELTPNKKFKLKTTLSTKIGKTPTANKSKTDEKNPAKKKALIKKTEGKGEKKKAEIISTKKTDQSAIINSFLKESPTIKIDKNDLSEEITDLSNISNDFPEEAITENLAVILQKQDKNELAIEVYQKLILKIPEKKAYFASQIQKIKKK